MQAEPSTNTHTPATIARAWAEAVALCAELLADEGPDEREADWDRYFALKKAALKGPITSRADAAAKLKAVHETIDAGSQTNEHDAAALAQAIAWLEADA
jgi:hypothetical protein